MSWYSRPELEGHRGTQIMPFSMLMCDTNTHNTPSIIISPAKELHEKYLVRVQEAYAAPN